MSIRSESGVTLPELLIVLAVLGILVGLVFGPFDDLLQSNTKGLKSVVQAADTRGALRQIERDITISNSFLYENNISDLTYNLYGTSSTAWRWDGSRSSDAGSRVLITENYGTTELEGADGNGTRIIVKGGWVCAWEWTLVPYNVNHVYYVYNGVLYKRTIKNPYQETGCNGTIAQKRTCRIGLSNSNCEARDAVILKDVTGFTVDYYVASNSPNPIANQYTNTSVPAGAKSVVISITTKPPGGDFKSLTSSLRITRLNGAT